MLRPIMSDSGITTDQTSLFHPQNGDGYLSEGQSEYTDGAVEQKFQEVQKTIDCVNNPLPDRPIYSQGEEDISESRSISRSSSCSAKLMNGSSSPSFQKAEMNESTPASGIEKEFPGRPQDIQRSFSTQICNPKKSFLSRQNSLTSVHSDVTGELKAHNTKKPAQDVTSIHTFVAELKESTKLESEKPLVENQVEETEPRISRTAKTVKDVGLDPLNDSPESPASWHLEFERKQSEIVELWQTCNVSLVHRTYFFLLFKGDPSDSIYMEVERRRLSFLKDLYAGGNTDKLPMEGARDLTPASSMRALRREREMLSKQMQKRFSEEERGKLYEKWGIGLNSKQRRLQLARRLWTETDLNHVTESANLVAKLMGLIEPRQALKEMFILSFTPQKTNRRSYSWRSST